jgi:hypothetical protein
VWEFFSYPFQHLLSINFNLYDKYFKIKSLWHFHCQCLINI